MTNEVFEGVIPPVATIFHETGEIDIEGMKKLINFLIKKGVHGLFFNGTGGEFSQMNIEQRKEVAEFAVKYVNGRLPVLIGTGSNSTSESIALSKHAENIGADAIVVINPYFWTLTEDNLFQYFSEIAESVELPMMLYNFPKLTGQDISIEMIKRLVDTHSNIFGIKESTSETDHYKEIILKIKSEYSNFRVFVGFDDHLLNNLSLGGDGVIPASANFIPEFNIDLYEAFIKEEYKKAIEIHKKIAYIPLFYKITTPFVGVAKEAMNLLGLDVSTTVLSPSQSLTEDEKSQVKDLLLKIGVINSN